MSMTGFTKVCAAHSAGINTIHFCKNSDLTSMTATSEIYTTITMDTTNVFTPYEFETDSAELSVESVRENGAQKHVSTLTFKLDQMTSATRIGLQELFDESDCGMVAIVTDSNGLMQVLGYSETHAKARPLRVVSGEAKTGKALTDENGASLTLMCESAEYPHFNTTTIPV
jgi:hypothetical protein